MKQHARFALGAAWLVVACQAGSNPLQPRSTLSQDLSLDAGSPHAVPGQYIVVFKRGVANPGALARTLVTVHGGSLRHTYATALKGFAARLSDAAVAALRRKPLVAYFEPAHKGSAAGTPGMDANGAPSWVAQIDHRTPPLDHHY